MLERDDEDLAIEQLPGAGRADDPTVPYAVTFAAEPPQEQTAARAEPTQPATASATQLRELRTLIERQRAQLEALPTRQLQRIEDLNVRATTLSSKCEQTTERLGELPASRRRLGREHDPHAVERTHLTNALQAGRHELDDVLAQRDRLEQELGDPAEIRAERDGLQRALAQHTREHTEIRNKLAERELHAPGAWARATFGERPDEPRPREVWENAVRQAARYRVQYDILDPSHAVGKQPEQREQQRDWEKAHEAVERAERRLGRETQAERGVDVKIGL
jgi:hypothetical protein